MGKEKSQINLNYDRQLENNQAQNQWQSAENAIDREFQAEQWMKQFQAQVEQQLTMFEKEGQRYMDQWKQQFEMQNAYNSPEQQVKRLMAAGINPAALASSLTGGNSSAGVGGISTGASSPSPSVPGSHGVSPMGVSPQLGSTDAAIFGSVAQMADSVAKLGQSAVGSYGTVKKLDSEINKNISEKNVNDSQASYTEVLTNLKKQFGESESVSSIEKNFADSYAAYMKGDLDSANKSYTKALETLTGDETLRKRESWPVVLANMRKYGQELDSQIGLNQAKAGEARSQTSLNQALTQTENDLRSGRIEALDLANKCQSISNELASRQNLRDKITSADQVQAIVYQCEREGIINEQVKQQVTQMVLDNNWHGVKSFFDCLSKAASSVGSVAGAYGSVKGVSIGERRNEIQQEFNSVWSDYLRNKQNGSPVVVSGFNN